MFHNIFDSYSMDSEIIYNDTSNYMFDYCSENGNNENNIYDNFKFEFETPSSSKRTDADEQNNMLKSVEENNIINDNEHNNCQEIDIKQIEIEEEIKTNEENPVTQTNSEKMKYTKFNPANMIRKTKHILLDNILNFLNALIRKIYNIKNITGFNLRQFKTLNRKEKSESNIQYNKDFLGKTIGEILSEKISKKLTSYTSDHNKDLVQLLLSEKNISIQTFFKNLFNLTFFDYLEHFRGTKNYVELKGMTTLNKVLEKYSDEPDYIESLNYYFQNYEIIINKKKTRNSKKKKGN